MVCDFSLEYKRLGFVLTLMLCLWNFAGAQNSEELPVLEMESSAGSTLTLSEALSTAIRLHPDLQESLARVEAGEFAVTASTSPLYPRFSISASAGQSGNSGQLGGEQVVRTGLQRSYGYGISLSQQLFDFGRTHHNIQLSELQLGVTRLNYLQVRQSVLDNVVQAYFNLLRQGQSITVNLENVRNAEQVLRQAQGFLEAGTGAKIAVIQAESDLASARFNLIQAKGAHARASADLSLAMGTDLLTDYQPEEVVLSIPEWGPDQVRKYALTTRLDVAAASLEVAQAETRIRLAKAEYFPIVSANAGYNWGDSVFPPQNTAYNVGLSLSVPLLNEPALSSAVGQAKANLKATLASFRSVEINAVREATVALFDLREASARAGAANETLRFATERFRLATERYNVGVGSALEVSDAQRQLVEARTLELQARFDVQNAVSSLLRSTGQIDSAALLPPDLSIDPIFALPDIIIPEK